MYFDIYPCDLTCDGSCPKPAYARNCDKCRGWTEREADMQIERENALDACLTES